MNPQRIVTSRQPELRQSRHTHSPTGVQATPEGLANDVLLPQQFFQPIARTHQLRGEVALLYAILDDAVSCLQKRSLSKGYRIQQQATDAELWFFTDDHQWPFSFINICSVLGLDPDYLRSGLTQWRHQHCESRQKKPPRTQVTHTPRLTV